MHNISGTFTHPSLLDYPSATRKGGSVSKVLSFLPHIICDSEEGHKIFRILEIIINHFRSWGAWGGMVQIFLGNTRIISCIYLVEDSASPPHMIRGCVTRSSYPHDMLLYKILLCAITISEHSKCATKKTCLKIVRKHFLFKDKISMQRRCQLRVECRVSQLLGKLYLECHSFIYSPPSSITRTSRLQSSSRISGISSHLEHMRRQSG